MNAIELLKQEHTKIRSLLQEFATTGERAFKTRENIAGQVFLDFVVHSRLEEEILYPATHEKAGRETRDLLTQSMEQNHLAFVIISQLKDMSPEDRRYIPRFTVMAANMERQFDMEEQRIFPESETHLADDLDSLGERMQRRRRELVELHSPSRGIGDWIAERVRDVADGAQVAAADAGGRARRAAGAGYERAAQTAAGVAGDVRDRAGTAADTVSSGVEDAAGYARKHPVKVGVASVIAGAVIGGVLSARHFLRLRR
ncbi:MAG: hemerythrin domain-containing protein [Dehalococcoidia bacterium]